MKLAYFFYLVLVDLGWGRLTKHLWWGCGLVVTVVSIRASRMYVPGSNMGPSQQVDTVILYSTVYNRVEKGNFFDLSEQVK